MRVALVLALLLSGCLWAPGPGGSDPRAVVEPLPGTGPADPAWTGAARVERPSLLAPNGSAEEARWLVRWTPGNLSAPAGEVARVRVEVEPTTPGAAGGFLELPQWVRTAGGLRLAFPSEGAAFELEVLLGPTATLGAYLRVGDGEGCCAYGALEGPALGLVPGGDAARAVARHDPVAMADGLHATANGTRARVVWVYRTTADHDCMEIARVAGQPVVRDGVLHLFVASGQSDACSGPSPRRTPRIEVDTAPLPPGELEVRLHVTEGCFCELQPWRTQTARLTIPAAG